MKTLLLLTVACLASCTAIPGTSKFDERSWNPTSPNPLDGPGETPDTVESLHAKNVRLITGNPTL